MIISRYNSRVPTTGQWSIRRIFPILFVDETGFPVVESVTGTAKGSFNPASWNVNMPATVNSGDLLLMLELAGQDSVGGTITPSGWTQVNTVDDGETFRYHLFAKIASGSEGGTTVTITYGDTDINAAAQVYRISSWWGTIATGIEATSSLVTGTSIDCASLNPTNWDIQRTLWIAACGHRIDQYIVTDIPANYTNGIKTIDTSFGPAETALLSSRRKLEAASEDPGAQPATLTDALHKMATTIAIRPAATGGPIIPVLFHHQYVQRRAV